MQQFWLQDLKFFANDHKIPLAHLQAQAWEIDLVSMTIDNQKNGKQGKILSHHALTAHKPCGCPVSAVIKQTIDLLNDGAMEDTIICAYCKSLKLAWHYIWSIDIVTAMKDALPATKTNHHGCKKSKLAPTHFNQEEPWCCSSMDTIHSLFNALADGQVTLSWNISKDS